MARLRDIILSESSALLDEAIRIRRHFHRYPELSFRETNTSAFIEDYLGRCGITFRKNIAGTGIIGRIDGNRSGDRVIAIRAEMDALPITEQNTIEYKSTTPGHMHACGHDANMAALLCIATILKNNSDKFGGTVLLVFQPGEEKSPGGAKLMIGSGELYNPKPDIVLAQHALPELETGMVGYKPGLYMASSDEIYITINGKGGHAALADLVTDQILIASKLIIRLKESIAAKQAENNIPTVFGIGRITGDGATNVIPDKVEIAGTFRTFNEGWRAEAQKIIRDISGATAREYGIDAEVAIGEGYPVLQNDVKVTGKAIDLSVDLLGKENVRVFQELRMSSDDFSFYSGLAPSLYVRYGIKEKGKEMKKLHTSGFDIDEKAMGTAISNMCWLVLNFLSGGSDDNKEKSQ